MAWLEITIDTASEKIDSVVTSLTAAGFADLVIEDQEEFETFLEQNREYWTTSTRNFRKNYRACPTLKYIWKTPTPLPSKDWRIG